MKIKFENSEDVMTVDRDGPDIRFNLLGHNYIFTGEQHKTLYWALSQLCKKEEFRNMLVGKKLEEMPFLKLAREHGIQVTSVSFCIEGSDDSDKARMEMDQERMWIEHDSNHIVTDVLFG